MPAFSSYYTYITHIQMNSISSPKFTEVVPDQIIRDLISYFYNIKTCFTTVLLIYNTISIHSVITQSSNPIIRFPSRNHTNLDRFESIQEPPPTTVVVYTALTKQTHTVYHNDKISILQLLSFFTGI